MITNLDTQYINGNDLLEAVKLCGVSADTKPTNVGNGSTLHEIDTGKDYMFDAEGKEWYEQTSGGGSGGDSAPTLVVTFQVNEDYDEVLEVDHTLEEMMAVTSAGGYVVARVLDPYEVDYYMPLREATEENGVTFKLTECVSASESAINIYSYDVGVYDNSGTDAPWIERNIYQVAFTEPSE